MIRLLWRTALLLCIFHVPALATQLLTAPIPLGPAPVNNNGWEEWVPAFGGSKPAYLDGSGNLFVTSCTGCGAGSAQLGVVGTNAALRALSPGQYAQVQLTGYYSAGDMGPVTYTWNALCPGTIDGATYVAPNAGGGGCWSSPRSIQLNVRQFGAHCDATGPQTGTDDSAALTAAFNYGNVFLPGLCAGKAITITTPNLTISCAQGGGLAIASGPVSGTRILYYTGPGPITINKPCHMAGDIFPFSAPAAPTENVLVEIEGEPNGTQVDNVNIEGSATGGQTGYEVVGASHVKVNVHTDSQWGWGVIISDTNNGIDTTSVVSNDWNLTVQSSLVGAYALSLPVDMNATVPAQPGSQITVNVTCNGAGWSQGKDCVDLTGSGMVDLNADITCYDFAFAGCFEDKTTNINVYGPGTGNVYPNLHGNHNIRAVEFSQYDGGNGAQLPTEANNNTATTPHSKIFVDMKMTGTEPATIVANLAAVKGQMFVAGGNSYLTLNDGIFGTPPSCSGTIVGPGLATGAGPTFTTCQSGTVWVMYAGPDPVGLFTKLACGEVELVSDVDFHCTAEGGSDGTGGVANGIIISPRGNVTSENVTLTMNGNVNNTCI